MNIAIIPARGGSKRLRNKNLINFFGKPLIYYSIIAAKRSKLFKKIIVSTDSKKIKKKFQNNTVPKFLFCDQKKTIKRLNKGTRSGNTLYRIFKKKKKLILIMCAGIYPTAPLIQINDLKKDYQKIKKSGNMFFCM